MRCPGWWGAQMQDYQTLIIEHDHLKLLADRMLGAVAGAPDIGTAIGIRSELSVAVGSHLTREEHFFYEELMAPRDGKFPAAVAEFRSSFASLTEAWSDYLRHWDADGIAADWAGFARQTTAMMNRLRERIADENRLLYPLALQSCRIRLRTAA